MKSINLAVLMVASMIGSGCASIVTGHNQSVSLETRAKQGQAVAGASCKLTNDKGSWFVTSPGSVTVRRSYEDLLVSCEKDGAEPGQASVKSSTKAMAFGNILFGGVIGAGVDVASGAAYDYPPVFTVLMGEKITIDAPPANKEKEPAPQASDTAQAKAVASNSVTQ